MIFTVIANAMVLWKSFKTLKFIMSLHYKSCQTLHDLTSVDAITTTNNSYKSTSVTSLQFSKHW